MAEDTNAIRAEIAETRERLAETAGAVGYKVDVPDRMRDAVSETAGTVKERLTGGVGRATETTREAVSGTAERVNSGVRRNPMGAFLGGAAAGLLVGMLVPTTRVENEKLGPTGDRLRERAVETGERAIDRGAEMASRAADRASETVEQAGRSGSDVQTPPPPQGRPTSPRSTMWSMPAAPDVGPEAMGE